MEQCFNDTLYTFSDEDEIACAEILVQLKRLAPDRCFTWGSRKRRSYWNPKPALPSPPVHVVGPAPAIDPTPADKVAASSPATPLSFSPSESDEKPKRSKKKRPKLPNKEELLETIKQFTEENRELQGEIEKVSIYLETLKAQNLELKARSSELGESQKRKPGALKGSVNNEEPAIRHEQPAVEDQRAEKSGSGEKIWCAIDSSVPVGIPDLNVSLEEGEAGEAWEKEMAKKAMAAEARKRRLEIKRLKNASLFVATNRTRFPPR